MFGRFLLLALVAILPAACSTRAAGPSQVLEDGLELRLQVQPNEVRVHEAFTAQLAITNRRGKSVTLVGQQSCIAFFSVYSENGQASFSGTEQGCFMAVSRQTLRPGQSLRRAWPVWAETVEGAPVPPGEYVLRITFDTELFEINGSPANLPQIEHRFVVR